MNTKKKINIVELQVIMKALENIVIDGDLHQNVKVRVVELIEEIYRDLRTK